MFGWLFGFYFRFAFIQRNRPYKTMTIKYYSHSSYDTQYYLFVRVWSSKLLIQVYFHPKVNVDTNLLLDILMKVVEIYKFLLFPEFSFHLPSKVFIYLPVYLFLLIDFSAIDILHLTFFLYEMSPNTFVFLRTISGDKFQRQVIVSHALYRLNNVRLVFRSHEMPTFPEN